MVACAGQGLECYNGLFAMVIPEDEFVPLNPQLPLATAAVGAGGIVDGRVIAAGRRTAGDADSAVSSMRLDKEP